MAIGKGKLVCVTEIGFIRALAPHVWSQTTLQEDAEGAIITLQKNSEVLQNKILQSSIIMITCLKSEYRFYMGRCVVFPKFPLSIAVSVKARL
jgi:hypothetical protein